MTLNKKMLQEAVKHAKKAMAEIEKVNAALLPATENGDWLEARRFCIHTNLLNEVSIISGESIERSADPLDMPYRVVVDGVPFEAYFIGEKEGNRYERI